MRWYVRRLQKMNHGSYMISIPSTWVKSNSLMPHDELYIVEVNPYLIIYNPLQPEAVKIDLALIEDVELLKHLIYVYYMQGADTIIITNSNGIIDGNIKSYIKGIMSRLKGAELYDVTLNSVTYKIDDGIELLTREKFLSHFERNFAFIIGLLNDLVDAVGNEIILDEIIERALDIDKRYRHIIRIISKMSIFPHISILNSYRELLAYTAMAKDLYGATRYISKLARILLEKKYKQKDITEILMYLKENFIILSNLLINFNIDFIKKSHIYYRKEKEFLGRLNEIKDAELMNSLKVLINYSLILLDDILQLHLSPPYTKKAQAIQTSQGL